MRLVQKALLAGIGAMAVAGTAALAAGNHHEITVNIPNSGVAHIEYTGDVAPKDIVDSDAMPVTAFTPEAFFGPGSPFAELDRIQAQMDRQIQVILRDAQTTLPQSGDNRPMEATFGGLPPGVQSYSIVSTMSGGHACLRSIEVTTSANGGKPNVVSRVSGDCSHAMPSAVHCRNAI
jgi:hypothetical protein